MRVLGLSRSLAHFSFFFSASKFAPSYLGPFFTFPDNFTPSILIAKNNMKLNSVAFSSGFSFTYCVLSILLFFIKCVVALLIWWVMGHA